MKLISVLAPLLLAGCATSQSDFTRIGGSYSAKANNHPIDIFLGDDLPSRQYIEIAILEVHLETSGLVTRAFSAAEPKIEEQARAAGGDAVVEIKEFKTRHLENMIYHVTAKAIKYAD